MTPSFFVPSKSLFTKPRIITNKLFSKYSVPVRHIVMCFRRMTSVSARNNLIHTTAKFVYSTIWQSGNANNLAFEENSPKTRSLVFTRKSFSNETDISQENIQQGIQMCLYIKCWVWPDLFSPNPSISSAMKTP